MQIIMDEGVELTEVQKEEALQGVTWLKDWITERHKNGTFKDRIDSSRSEDEIACDAANGDIKYQESMDRLDNVTICVVDNKQEKTAAEYTTEYIKEQVRTGKLHFSEDYLEQYDGDLNRAIEEYSFTTNGGDNFLGVYNNDIKEPTIFITKETIDKGVTKSIVTHECTHMLELSDSELTASPIRFEDDNGIAYTTTDKNGNEIILNNPDIIADDYYDEGREIYARLMQVRQEKGLSPHAVFTEKDVSELRKQNEEEFRQYKISLGLDPDKLYDSKEIKEAQQAHPEINTPKINLNIFSRYTDEQIAHLLNETAALPNNVKNEMSQDAQTMYALLENISLQPDSRDIKTAMLADARLCQAKLRVMDNVHSQLPEKERDQQPRQRENTLSPTMLMQINGDCRA